MWDSKLLWGEENRAKGHQTVLPISLTLNLWILRAHIAFSMGTDWLTLGWSRDRCQYVINSEQTPHDIRSCRVPPHRDLSARQAKPPNGRGDLNAPKGLYCCLQCPSPGTSHEMMWLWLDHKRSEDADAKGRIWIADRVSKSSFSIRKIVFNST